MNWNTYHEQYQSGAGRNPLVSLRLREAWLSDARDGVLLEVGRLGREVGSGSLLLLLEAHTVPVVGQGSRLALPVLKEGHSWKRKDCVQITFVEDRETGSLLLLFQAHAVPVVGQGSRLALPVLKEGHS